MGQSDLGSHCLPIHLHGSKYVQKTNFSRHFFLLRFSRLFIG